MRYYLDTVSQEDAGSLKRARYLALAYGFHMGSAFLDLNLNAYDTP